jgi:uncharacterized protein YybS (DUF2232 family)
VVLSAALIYVGAGLPAAVLMVLLLLGVGIVLGWAVRQGWKFDRSFALTAFGGFAALGIWGVLMWQAFAADLTWLRDTAYQAIDAQYVGMGMSADSAEAASRQFRSMVDAVPYVTPGLLGMSAILLAVCSLGLAYWIFPRVREKVPVSMALSGFRMHWATAYTSIAGLAMLLFASGDSSWSTAVMYAGINVLLVSQTLFFVQGLAVARWLAVNRHMGPGARVAVYLAAVLGQMLFQLTGLVGLFDTWVDYRKRFALKGLDTRLQG